MIAAKRALIIKNNMITSEASVCRMALNVLILSPLDCEIPFSGLGFSFLSIIKTVFDQIVHNICINITHNFYEGIK